MYKIKPHTTNINYNNDDLTIKYNYSKAELGYFDGTGTFEGVEILKVYKDTVNITRQVEHNFDDYEKLVLKQHIENGL
tara:strand:- start:1282 stop:1515 length:234 start_codon:yes stop_codon:yes gene_type:complete